jgi:hypothetical protein
MLEAGEIRVSHLAQIAGKITQANQDLILQNIKGKSWREIQLFLSQVTPDGRLLPQEEFVEIKLRMSKTQLALLQRAREILASGGAVPTDAEILLQAVEDLLTKRDPMRKAERAAARQREREIRREEQAGAGDEGVVIESAAAKQRGEMGIPAAAGQEEGRSSEKKGQRAAAQQRFHRPSRYIAAHERHAVWLRDGGRCTHIYTDGSRCQERMMLELDHLHLFCRGGSNDARNLRLTCRYHNTYAAGAALGADWFDRRRGRESS